MGSSSPSLFGVATPSWRTTTELLVIWSDLSKASAGVAVVLFKAGGRIALPAILMMEVLSAVLTEVIRQASLQFLVAPAA